MCRVRLFFQFENRYVGILSSFLSLKCDLRNSLILKLILTLFWLCSIKNQNFKKFAALKNCCKSFFSPSNSWLMDFQCLKVIFRSKFGLNACTHSPKAFQSRNFIRKKVSKEQKKNRSKTFQIRKLPKIIRWFSFFTFLVY